LLHLETIAPRTLALLKELMADSACAEFALGGGTAIALQIGHRISIDLDLFTTSTFTGSELLGRLNCRDRCEVISAESANTLLLMIDGIKVDMIRFNYPQNAALLVEDGIRMYDLPDLVPMKLGAICGRGARKDFYDVACLLERCSLRQMLDWYRAKYPQYELFPVLKSLVYFDDAEDQPEPNMLWPIAWGEVKERVAEAVAREVREGRS
jgi:hypothetical protein